MIWSRSSRPRCSRSLFDQPEPYRIDARPFDVGDILNTMPVQPDSAFLHQHAVQFYGTDESLFTTVAGFLASGLVAGQPAVVIATPAHRSSIVKYLRDRLIDCDRALRNGDLVLLDAEATLDL